MGRHESQGTIHRQRLGAGSKLFGMQTSIFPEHHHSSLPNLNNHSHHALSSQLQSQEDSSTMLKIKTQDHLHQVPVTPFTSAVLANEDQTGRRGGARGVVASYLFSGEKGGGGQEFVCEPGAENGGRG